MIITRKTAMVKDGLDALFAGMRCIVYGEFVKAQRYLFFLGWTPSDVPKKKGTD